jgi:serine/threonine-protein kinase
LPVLIVFLTGITWTILKRSPAPAVKQVVVRYYPDANQAASGVMVTVSKNSEEQSKEASKGEAGKKGDKPSIARVRTVEETIGTAAVMNLVILPWGEVYLDGRMQGISPPLLELQVAPGKHEIEIRNTSFPAYKKSVQVKVGERLKINHTFAK